MAFILDGLYIGSLDDCNNQKFLSEKGITHILTVYHKPLPALMLSQFECKFVYALDTENHDLLTHFDESYDFIECGRQSGAVLVHCYAGVSRSATIVLAFIMKKMNMNVEDAISLVKHHHNIHPNEGFVEQLQLYELMNKTTDKHCQEFKLYKLNLLTQQIQNAQISDMSMDTFSEDPCSAVKSDIQDENCFMYKCRKCRRPLFRSNIIFSHSIGVGNAAFDWRSHLSKSNTEISLSNVNEDSMNCQQSLFIEPVQWMGEEILLIEGKIGCPKCQAKLGSFNWSGERCPCGTWVTPAFHIQSSKVDRCKIQPVIPITTNTNSKPTARVIPCSSYTVVQPVLGVVHGYTREDYSCEKQS